MCESWVYFPGYSDLKLEQLSGQGSLANGINAIQICFASVECLNDSRVESQASNSQIVVITKLELEELSSCSALDPFRMKIVCILIVFTDLKDNACF